MLSLSLFCSHYSFAQELAVTSEGEADVGISAEKDESSTKKVAEEGGGSEEEAPIPSFARRVPLQPEFLLKHKREGWFVTGFPALGVDPDTGFNFGAIAQIYDNGEKSSPFFRITPYRRSIQAAVVFSTKKTMQFQVYYDEPYLMDTPWRIRGDLFFERNPVKNYFGIGNAGQQLTFPGTGQVFGSYDDYKNALSTVVGGQTNKYYDTYKDTRTGLRATAEYSLLGGWLRPLFGLQLAHIWIGDYSGDNVDGAVQDRTHLQADCISGSALGCNGGWDIFAKIGIVFDTRDFEPDPTKGIYWDAISELSPKFLGSNFNYGRLNTTLRAYAPIFDYKKQRLVLAGRFFYQWQFGDIPFYSMNVLAFSDRDKTGLGGYRSIRGYRLDRFIGPVAMMTNAELRWTFYDFTVWNQFIKLGLKPFVDAGRVFDKVSDTSFKDWKLGGGAGLMLTWNLATVISFDAAWSPEGSAFYMDIGAQF